VTLDFLRHWRRWRRPAGRLALAGILAVLATALWRSGLEAPEPSLLVRDRHQRFLADVAAEPERGYGFWPIAELPPRVVAATLAIEDRRFAWHPGVDPLAIGRALWQNLRHGERVSGASTVAMQIARLQRPGGRGYARKALEALTAACVTLRHGRQEVLAHYLRLVPYGNQVHGIEYAARRYLDKPVADLSWAEVAFLTAIPQSPTRMNPYDPRGRARAVERGRRILAVLAERGEIAAGDLELAQAQIARLAIPARRQRPDVALHVILRLERELRAGALPPEWRGQPLVDLPLDLDVQREMAWILGEEVDRWRPRGAGNGALLVVDTQTWEVVAALGSTDFFGAEGAGAIDYLRVPRSPGSTLKPFVYALALENGLITPATVLDDLRRGAGGIANSDAVFLGPMLPRAALANSRNVPAADLLSAVGVFEAWDLFADLGLHQREESAERFGLGMVIGSLPVRLEDLVRAYTALSGEGVWHDLRSYPGQRLAPSRRLLSPEVARLISHFLSDPSARLPTFPRLGYTEFPFAVAVKTGTSSQYKDALSVAYSSRYLVGAWIGHPDHRSMLGVTGYLASGVVQRAMAWLHPTLRDGQQASIFQPPASYQQARLCPYSGRRAGPACDRSELEWLPAAQAAALEECQVHVRLAIDRRDGLLASHWTPRAEVELRAFADLPPRYATFLNEHGIRTPPVATSRLGTGSAPDLLPAPSGERGAVAASSASTLAAAGKLRITSPSAGQRLLFDPEVPRELATVALAVEIDRPAPIQILWRVDGEPFALKEFPFTARWPLTPGAHHIQAEVPGTGRRSPVVQVIVD
jgi:penicillin-binding protein 1C